MPCRSDHCEPSAFEIAASRAFAVLDELCGGPPVTARDWAGYHRDVYSRAVSRAKLDEITSQCCALLALRHGGARGLSLEAQLWWREHQAADARRCDAETKAANSKRLQEQALSKLTAQEREALGFEVEWMPADTAPHGVVVATKIDDSRGVRNEQLLRREGRLWWLSDGTACVYYVPTHWRPA